MGIEKLQLVFYFILFFRFFGIKKTLDNKIIRTNNYKYDH